MSFSFTVSVADKAAAKQAVAAEINKVIAAQPVYFRVHAVVLANANAVIDLLADEVSKDVHVSCNGYVAWSGGGTGEGAPFSTVSIGCSACLRPRA